MISIARSAAVAAKPKCTRLGRHRAAVPNAGAMPRPARPRTTCIGSASRQRTFVVRTAAFSQSVVPAAVGGICLCWPSEAAAGELGTSEYSVRRRFGHENFRSKLPVTSQVSHALLPNPSLERTSTGWPRYTVLLFSAPRGQPVASAQLKR